MRLGCRWRIFVKAMELIFNSRVQNWSLLLGAGELAIEKSKPLNGVSERQFAVLSPNNAIGGR